MNDAELARRIEAHFFTAWPAMAEMDLDGWRVRISSGYSDRANCVTPMNPGALHVAEKIKWCERFYNDRQLPVIVRISEMCGQPGLDAWLQERGYRMSWAMETASCALAQVAPPADVVLESTASEGWLDAALAVDGRITPHLTPFTFILRHMPKPSCYARIGDGAAALAVGAATVKDDLMAVFVMRTHEKQRRKGHGRAVLDALMNWGAGQGAARAWLQFDRDNDAAKALYRAAGFAPVYNYHYRKQTSAA
jgi:ribosomal protein S18 acetylase RimI-like enzyme